MATLRITDVEGVGFTLPGDFTVDTLLGVTITATSDTEFSGDFANAGLPNDTIIVRGSGFTFVSVPVTLPIGGIVTGIEFYVNGNLTVSLSDVAVDIPTLYLWAALGLNEDAVNAIFGGDDSVVGTSFADTLLGFLGNDTLDGGAQGDWLEGLEGNDSLLGGSGNDTLSGSDGGDLLDGGLGNDIMLGGADNDSYVVNAAGDAVLEAAGQGTDTVRTTLAVLTLAADVEALIGANAIAHTLTGNELANSITGNVAADSIVGGDGNDTMWGGLGNDTLDGGAGTDRLVGGGGGDTYVLDDTPDVVVELLNQGLDTIRTTRAVFALPLNVENLVATNAIAHALTGNTLANAITGNAGADTLNGAAGNDTLDGGAGIDRLIGSLGDDRFVITAGDLVVEALNQGNDTVDATTGAAHVLGANLETLVLSGAAVLNGAGNGLANTIIGNGNVNVLQGAAGDDSLSGGANNDVLIGGAGRDTMSGGTGVDQFRFVAATDSPLVAPDRLADFTPGVDRIDLRLLDGNIATLLTFVAGAPAAAGQVGVIAMPGVNQYRVLVDLVGGGATDLAVDLTSASAPSAGWFLL